jgi:hypothetical protein
MTALEIATMLNITEAEAHDLIDTCDEFDRSMQRLYAERSFDENLQELIEAADWDMDFCQ